MNDNATMFPISYRIQHLFTLFYLNLFYLNLFYLNFFTLIWPEKIKRSSPILTWLN